MVPHDKHIKINKGQKCFPGLPDKEPMYSIVVLAQMLSFGKSLLSLDMSQAVKEQKDT